MSWPSRVWAQAKEKGGDAKAAATPEGRLEAPQLFEKWKVQFEAGGRNFGLHGDHPGKFLETRDLIRGAYIRSLDMRFESGESPYIFSLKGSDIRELDETISAVIWRVGKFRTSFLWDRLPHFYSDGTSLFQTAAPGVLVVAPAIRGAFQAAVDGQVPQTISTLAPTLVPMVRRELAVAPVSDLRVKRDQVGLRQTIRFGGLELHGQWRSTFSRGNRPKGIGTFARQNIGGGVGDAVWESIGVELPEPVDYRTDELTVGALVSGKKWRLGVDYNLSLFRNNVPTLTYENPFRVTDAVALASAPLAVGLPQPPINPGSAIGRNRFVRQQISLPPNTDYHSVTAWGGFDLPRDTQFRGLFSWGQSTQNDQFLPYTLNTALVGSAPGLANNLPPGTSPLNVSSLPQQSLNGKVRTLNYDSTLVSKPWRDMNFRLQYRAEDMKNKSPRIVFPGQSRFGDSHWVTKEDYYGLPIENFPTSFVKQDAIASWRWDLAPRVTWNAEYQFETWKRVYRDVPHTYEHSVNGRLDFKLASKSNFKLDYRYSNRKPDTYITTPLVFNPAATSPAPAGVVQPPYPAWEVARTANEQYPQFQRGVPLEFNLLRRFDVTDRRRHEGGAALDVGLGDKVTFSLSGQYLRNNYSKGFYGLQFDELASADAEVTFTAGDRTFLYVNYSRQLDRYHALGMGALINGAVVNGSPCCAQYPIPNTWERTSRSTLNFVQTGVNWASNGEKTAIDLSYGYTFARDRIHALNPFPILLNSPVTAGAYNYPDTKNGYQEVYISGSRRLRPGLDLGGQYLFEAYRLDDFYLNSLQPYPQGLVITGGIPVNLPRQLLLNARFTTYHAHMVGFFLRYKF